MPSRTGSLIARGRLNVQRQFSMLAKDSGLSDSGRRQACRFFKPGRVSCAQAIRAAQMSELLNRQTLRESQKEEAIRLAMHPGNFLRPLNELIKEARQTE